MISKREEFEVNFLGQLVFGSFMSLCCDCFKRFCAKCRFCERQLAKYEKFQISLERLSKEQDIQHFIALNRLSHLVHKTFFLTRQRRAVNLARKFVISDKDMHAESKNSKVHSEADNFEYDADKILTEFDPEQNEADRRLLFEITGLQLQADEFTDSDSASSSDGVSQTNNEYEALV